MIAQPIPEPPPARSARAPRPRELQDALNFRLFHPLAWKLALGLSRTPITPNMVSIAGALLVVAATYFYVQPGWPVPVLIGFALHLSWHVVDGADGDLARLTGRSGPTGELIDGICDYVGHVILYVALALVLQDRIGAGFAWAAVIAAGVSRIVQSNFFEVQRRQYQWWVYGVPWLRTTGSGDDAVGRTSFAAFGAGYLSLATKLSPRTGRIDAAVEEAGGDADRLLAIRAAITRHVPELLPRYQLLSANHRTVVLGLSMLAGSPLYFFLYEAVVLNLVLVRSIHRSGRAAAAIVQDIALQEAGASTSR